MMRESSLLIGIHLPAGHPAEYVQQTLMALSLAQGLPQVKVLLFVPGLLPENLPALPDRIEVFSAPGGKASCFNKLISYARSDHYLFLEAGLLPGPYCISMLLDALSGNDGTGLAGPSASHCWNEQGQLPERSSGKNYRHSSRLFRERYGEEHVKLLPLHSLADFCYLVKREVVETIGAADEAFAGPCWEMDYNIRAARAGYDGVWVKGAYAERTLPAADEDLSLAKALYQKKFCSRQLTGAGEAFRDHCFGEACENFAPRQEIRLYQELPQPDERAKETFRQELPVISCVMPTARRPQFVKQAVKYFREQDYPRKELIIVYNDEADLPEDRDAGPDIRYIHTAIMSIGGKRNVACLAAKGALIAQWDDDDVYRSDRLSLQAAPLLRGEAEITGLTGVLFYEYEKDCCWECSPELFRKIFVGNVQGGTLVYLRSLWNNRTRYPDTSLREDADFLVKAMDAGARLQEVDGRDCYLYLRHSGNTWKFAPGSFMFASGWRQTTLPDWMEDNMPFYQDLPKTSVDMENAQQHEQVPLVSCIMPTANRDKFVPLAIQYFLRQDYPCKELIVIDDGVLPVKDLIPELPQIRYVRLPGNAHKTGTKRNIACEHARGEIILHWDDDDWYASDWISLQVEALKKTGADVTGLSRLFFYDPLRLLAWDYQYASRFRPWVAGATMAYTREAWKRFPFRDLQIGEDNAFVWNPKLRVVPHEHMQSFVSILHSGNTSPKYISEPPWKKTPAGNISRILREDLERYEKLLKVSKYFTRF